MRNERIRIPPGALSLRVVGVDRIVGGRRGNQSGGGRRDNGAETSLHARWRFGPEDAPIRSGALSSVPALPTGHSRHRWPPAGALLRRQSASCVTHPRKTWQRRRGGDAGRHAPVAACAAEAAELAAELAAASTGHNNTLPLLAQGIGGVRHVRCAPRAARAAGAPRRHCRSGTSPSRTPAERGAAGAASPLMMSSSS